MSPGAQFGWGLLLGGVLGVFYDFLRPLRGRNNAPADLVFVFAMIAVWVQFQFGLCAGQIRLATTSALGLGFAFFELSLSRLTKPVFFWFWRVVFSFFGIITLPVKKFFEKIRKITKKVFASFKKTGTMEGNRRRISRRKLGGNDREKEICQSQTG